MPQLIRRDELERERKMKMSMNGRNRMFVDAFLFEGHMESNWIYSTRGVYPTNWVAVHEYASILWNFGLLVYFWSRVRLPP